MAPRDTTGPLEKEMCAMQRVLEVTELLDGILLQARPEDAIMARRVSKTFKSTIDYSPQLRHHISNAHPARMLPQFFEDYKQSLVEEQKWLKRSAMIVDAPVLIRNTTNAQTRNMIAINVLATHKRYFQVIPDPDKERAAGEIMILPTLSDEKCRLDQIVLDDFSDHPSTRRTMLLTRKPKSWTKVEAAFPKHPIPVKLELAVVCDGRMSRAAYLLTVFRLSLKLQPVSSSDVYHIVRNIRGIYLMDSENMEPGLTLDRWYGRNQSRKYAHRKSLDEKIGYLLDGEPQIGEMTEWKVEGKMAQEVATRHGP